MQFSVGDWTINPETCEATRGSDIRRLEARQVAVLDYLARNAGRTVTKNELLDAVWQRTEVSEHSVTVVISDLRRTLGDDSRYPRYIRTIPRKGYRLVTDADIQAAPGDDQPPPPLNGTMPPPGPAGRENGLRPVALWAAACLLGVAVIVSILWTVTEPTSAPATGLNTEPARRLFTTMHGREMQPAFSPDGSQVVFAWNQNKAQLFEIFVRPVGSDDLLQLSDLGGYSSNPVWSPVGNQIAFMHWDISEPKLACHVYIVSAIGGTARRAAECGTPSSMTRVAWSRDGQALFYTKHEDAEPARIMRMALDTFQETPVTAPPEGSRDGMATISPDGSMLGFARFSNGRKVEIFVQDLGADHKPAGQPRLVRELQLYLLDLDWQPDSAGFILTTDQNNVFGLWIQRLDGGPPVEAAALSTDVYAMAVSPDGRTWVLDQRQEAVNLVREPLDRPRPSPLPTFYYERHYVTRSTRFEWNPAFSPDGRQMVYLSDRTASNQLFVANADGSNERRLTDLKDNNIFTVAWSPDGAWIAFGALVDGNYDIYLIRPDGGGMRKLTTDGAMDATPAWSPDGETVYFISDRAGAQAIWAIPVDGGDARRIGTDTARSVKVSSDGRTLFYTKPDSRGLWSFSPDTDEEPKQVVADQSWPLDNKWTVAGNTLYYVERQGFEDKTLYKHDLGTGEATALLPFPNTYFYLGLDVSADERYLLYPVISRYEGDLYLMTAGDTPS